MSEEATWRDRNRHRGEVDFRFQIGALCESVRIGPVGPVGLMGRDNGFTRSRVFGWYSFGFTVNAPQAGLGANAGGARLVGFCNSNVASIGFLMYNLLSRIKGFSIAQLFIVFSF